MWFDVQAALAEIDGDLAPRVAHVAHVARPPASESEVLGDGGMGDLTPDERDHYEERAAILEFDGGLPRADAERRALAEVLQLDHYRARKEGRE